MIDSGLEQEAECKLHHARISEFSIQFSEAGDVNQILIGQRSGSIETHRVGYVEHFPREFQSLVLFEVPSLSKTTIDTEISRTAEVVSLPGFSGVGRTEVRVKPITRVASAGEIDAFLKTLGSPSWSLNTPVFGLAP